MSEEQGGAAAAATISGELRLVNPGDVSRHAAGVPFSISFEQQIQPAAEGAAAIQFSDDPAGPWVTTRAPGGGGVVEAPFVAWSSQSSGFTIHGALQHGPAFIRGGVWQDQSAQGEELTGPPDVASNVVELRKPLKVVPAVEPDDPRPGAPDAEASPSADPPPEG